MKTLTADEFNKLFATDTVSGPADLADLARLLHAGGMQAAAWLIEAAQVTFEQQASDLEIQSDWISPDEHDQALGEKDGEIADLNERIAELEKECDTLTESTDGAAEILAFGKQVAQLRETIANQQTKIYALEATARQTAKPKRKRVAHA